MRGVVWSDQALAAFERAIRFIAAENPAAARLVADRIEEAVHHLATMPTGRPGRVSNTFEKPVPRTPYIIAYALTEDRLTILHMIHGRRNWPAEDWPES